MSPFTRDPDALERDEFDVLIVGGGINGTGAARDAARRGLKVALVEKDDYGYGTTGRSTRLIHGGLRYLEMYDFGLVRESLRERELLLKNAPHLVRPLPFLFPLYEGAGWKLKYRLGFLLYDLLSYDRSVAGHHWIPRDALRDREPALADALPDGARLRGAFEYHDAQIPNVERLCVENVLDAVAHGAVCVNHCEVDGFIVEDGAVKGARARDTLTGRKLEVSARVTFNATGPWLDALGVPTQNGRNGAARLRLTKGVHLVVPPVVEDAVILKAPDGRTFFAIPWEGRTLIGTTDTDWKGDPDEVSADDADVAYLVDAAAAALPSADLTRIDYTWAGVRSLVNAEGVSESQVSRKHLIVDHEKTDGLRDLFTLVGGKITPFRGVTKEVVDALVKRLGVKAKSDTRDAPLPGGTFDDLSALESQAARDAEQVGVDAESGRHLASLYGARYDEVLAFAHEDPALAARVCAHGPEILAEAAHAVENEGAVTLGDVLVRRSTTGWRPCEGLDEALDRVAGVIAPRLGWDDARVRREKAAYREEIAKRHRFTPTAPSRPAATRTEQAADA